MLWDDEEMKTPLAVLVAANWLLKIVAPQQPIWRLFIVLRRLQVWTGINALKRLVHELRNGRILSRFKNKALPSPAMRTAKG